MSTLPDPPSEINSPAIPSAEAIHESRRLLMACIESMPGPEYRAALETCGPLPLDILETFRLCILERLGAGESASIQALQNAASAAGFPEHSTREIQEIIDAGTCLQPQRAAEVIRADRDRLDLQGRAEWYATALATAARSGNAAMLAELARHNPFAEIQPGGAALGQRVDLSNWQALAARPIPFVAARLPRKCVTVLAAPGGVGKSMLSLALALGVARGETVLPSWRCTQGKVLMLSAEDAPEIVAQRLQAIGRLHGLSAADITDATNNMALYCDGGLPILQEQAGGGAVLTEHAADLRAAISAARPDLVSVDPVIRFYGCNENSNQAAAAFMDFFSKVSEANNCAVLLLHHTAKVAREAETVSAAHVRGAGAFLDQARSGLTLTPNAAGHLTLQSVKSNYESRVWQIILAIDNGAVREQCKDFGALERDCLEFLKDNPEVCLTLNGIKNASKGAAQDLRAEIVPKHPWATPSDLLCAFLKLVDSGAVRKEARRVSNRAVQVLVAA